MNKIDLQKKIASLLGVSNAEKELAYQIFIEKITGILSSGHTIKIPGLGFFQLKGPEHPSTQNKKSFVYSPFPEDFRQDDKDVYLILEAVSDEKKSEESGSEVFSIGVGKPLVPLFEKNNFVSETEASYILLKKSIEERVNEVISESTLLENFNIWNDYLSSRINAEKNDFLEGKKSSSALHELTSDLQYSEGAENLNEILSAEEIKSHFEQSELTIPDPDLSRKSLLDISDTQQIEPGTESEGENNFDGGDSAENVGMKLSLESLLEDNAEPDTSNDMGINPTKSASPLFINEAGKSEEFEGEINDENENVEWNWGDELKEEYGIGKSKDEEEILDISDEIKEKVVFSETTEAEKNDKTDLFGKLDETIQKEISELTRGGANILEEEGFGVEDVNETYYEPEEQMYVDRTDDYKFVADPNFNKEQKVVSTLRKDQFPNNENDDEFPPEGTTADKGDEQEKYFTKYFMLIFSGFVIVVSLFIYLFVFHENEISTANMPLNLNTQTERSQNLPPPSEGRVPSKAEQAGINVSKTPEENVSVPIEDFNKFPPAERAVTKTEPGKTNGSGTKTQETDIRVGNLIFFNGSKYSVQISSWKNRIKAEQEVSRLKGKGLNAFVMDANLPNKGGVWYRVRIGGFNSKEEAETFLANKNY